MIPAITHPLGRHWRQPSRDEILLDETHALMQRAAFDLLPEYSSTMPSGVYPGKMWRRHDGMFDRSCPPERRKWLLCWYAPLNDTHCKIETREVLFA